MNVRSLARSRPRRFVLPAVVALAIAATTAVAAPLITGARIANNSVAGVDIKNASISSIDLANNSVQGVDLRNGTVTAADLANGTVSTADLGDGSVTGAKLATGSVAADAIADGSVGLPDLSTATTTSLTDTSPWEAIPSGTTLTGVLREFSTNMNSSTIDTAMFQLPARPPVPIADVRFAPDDETESSGEDASCSGSIAAPAAPAGKLCIYLDYADGVSSLTPAAWPTAPGSQVGAWYIDWIWSGGAGFAGFTGSWAYTAP